jgi:SAM-dependent methyltransferase
MELWKFRDRILKRMHYLPRSTVRRCRACDRRTVFACIGKGDEFMVCVRCRATRRYELIAMYLRSLNLGALDVLELDYASPLRSLLSSARTYTRSFWRSDIPLGSVREDGAVCEDITRLTLPDASLDLIISSDVLEHVPDADAAFRESARVLRPGGAHLFTIPTRPRTFQRASLAADGGSHHFVPPEFHFDPLDARGILVYWDYGPDMGERFGSSGLDFATVAGPEGPDGRVVWAARKRA